MNDEHHAFLADLFDQADAPLADESFVAQVVRRADRSRRRARIVYGAAGFVVLSLLWLAAPAANQAMLWLASASAEPIVTVPQTIAAPLLSPLNSVGAVLTLAVLAARAIRKRLLR